MKRELKGRMMIVALFLGICMTFVGGSKCNAAEPQRVLLNVGSTEKIKAGNNLPKKIKTKKVKWKISRGKKFIKLNVAKNKKSVSVKGIKKGTAVVTLSYKEKKKQQYKITVMPKNYVFDDEDEDNSKEKKKIKKVESGPLTGLTVEGPDHALDWNESFVPKVTTIPKNAYAGYGYGYYYKYISDNEKVVKLGKYGGNFIAVGNGETTIHVEVYKYESGTTNVEENNMTYTGISASANVKVSYQEYEGKYHYQIFPIHPEFKPINGDSEYFYYLKTDNPDPSTIATVVEDSDGYHRKPEIVKGQSIDYYGYKIVDLGTEMEERKAGVTGEVYYRQTNKVPGGYILGLWIYQREGMSRDKTGTFKFNVYEKNVEKLGEEKGNTEDPREWGPMYSYEFEVVDEDTLWDDEAERIAAIAKSNVAERHRNEGTPLPTDETELFWEYCSAAQSVIAREYRYSYGLKAGSGEGVTSDGMPVSWIQSKVVTCWGAASLMSCTAKALGADKAGPYSVPGTVAHRNAKIIKNGVTKHFDATPSGSKYRKEYTDNDGVYHEATYKVVDYSDPRFKADWE